MSLSSDQLLPLASLRLSHAPVAVAFLNDPPAGLEHIDQPEAAGCGYWKVASEGRSFYTTAEDHQNCPVGAFTHGVALSEEKGKELQALIGTMIELKYLDANEIPGIPHRTAPMQVAAYAPLARAAFTPDVIVFRGNVRQIMILSEAARAAGVFDRASVMGRPACAMLPHASASGAGVASVGCIGNRVYTGLGDDEMYLTVPGSKVADLLANLPTILNANVELEKFHRQRQADLIA